MSSQRKYSSIYPLHGYSSHESRAPLSEITGNVTYDASATNYTAVSLTLPTLLPLTYVTNNSGIFYKSNAYPMHTCHGFTMIELIVTLAIVTIVSALAYPSVRGSFPRMNFNSQVSILQNDFQLTRFKAINRNCPYKIVFTLSTTEQDTYRVLYCDAGNVWKTDSNISNRTIKKDVDIAYIDNSGNTSGDFEKIFNADGSYGNATTSSEGMIFLKFADKTVDALGYDAKKKISITPATGFIRIVEGW